MVVGTIWTGTEVLVIGGGPGGYHAAAVAARLGKEVTLVEEGAIGGVCLNVGCIPSKALITGAKWAHAPAFVRQPGAVDFPALQAWKDEIVSRLTGGVRQILGSADVRVIEGTATFAGEDRVLVSCEHGHDGYRFKHCIIATGSSPAVIPGFEPNGGLILDSTGALALPAVPEELLVLGGGYIGLELGTAYAKLGSRVTIVEALDRLLPNMDQDLSRAVQRKLDQLGVKVQTGAFARRWSPEHGRARVLLEREGAESWVEADRVLVAVGRRPRSRTLELAAAGVEVTERSFIKVDESCRTANPKIFAIGDVAGEPMLAHKATKQAEVAAAVIAGKPAAYDVVAMPLVAFTDPEVASVGLTEAEAREQGLKTVVGRASAAASGRALTVGEPGGLVKVVADAESGLLLGVQIAGAEASEMIAEAALAVEMGARIFDLAETVHAHPTLSELLMEAARSALERQKR